MSENKENIRHEYNIAWQPIIELSIVLFTILGSTIPLYLHTDAKITAIHEEIKDFHGRLCMIEEKNRSKL